MRRLPLTDPIVWMLILPMVWCAWLMPSARAAETLPQELQGIEILDHLGQRIPLDLAFYNEKGERVLLSSYMDGKHPVLLTPVYYSCPMLCNLLLDGLVQGLKEMDWTPGENFQIVTFSIDPSETSDLAANKKANYVEEYGRPAGGAGWHWLVGDEPAIRKLTDALGFKYTYDEKENIYLHKAAVFVLTPDGTIARVMDKTLLPAKDIKMALLEAGEGKIGSMLDLFFLSCYHYDPQAGSYVPYAVGIMRLGGAVTLLLLAIAIGGLFWRERRQRRMTPAAGAEPPRPDSGTD